MTTISDVCKNLFNETNLSKLPQKKLTRGLRRNMARVLYRKMRRPGIVNPEQKTS